MLHYDPKHYLTYSELTQFLKSCADSYPELCQLESIGKTLEGRDIWLLTVTNKNTGSHNEKPAYWVDGNTHAVEVTGCQACVDIIFHCLTEYPKNPDIKKLLDEQTFYIVPRLCADGAELTLTSPHYVRSNLTVWPEADPLPGLVPTDIDNNGHIVLMRVPDPHGSWRISKKDARLMVLRRPDENELNTPYYNLFVEGEFNSEFVPTSKESKTRFGIDLNRQFPMGWDTKQEGSGDYPLSQPEAKAVVAAITSRPNIVGAQSFHTFSGVILRPYSAQEDLKIPHDDLEIYKALGQRGTEETGYPNISVYHDFRYQPRQFIGGTFHDWAYGHRGLFAYTNEIWHLAKAAGLDVNDPCSFFFGEIPEDTEIKILDWCDKNIQDKNYFIDWKPFEHKHFGSVELGGWNTMFTWSNPPRDFLPKEVEQNRNFVLLCARTNPRVVIKASSQIPLTPSGADKSLTKISVTLANAGYLPTYGSIQALENGVVKKPRVTIKKSAALEVIQGPIDTEIDHLKGRANNRIFKNSLLQNFAKVHHPVQNETKLEWVVRGNGNFEICVVFERAGTVRHCFEV